MRGAEVFQTGGLFEDDGEFGVFVAAVRIACIVEAVAWSELGEVPEPGGGAGGPLLITGDCPEGRPASCRIYDQKYLREMKSGCTDHHVKIGQLG